MCIRDRDFEPHFYAHGSEYEFAENTYKMGFRGITAGDWLRDIMRNEYGMQADSFHFSYDDKVYQPKEKPDNEKRVFFYARPVTPRRDFELGMLEMCIRDSPDSVGYHNNSEYSELAEQPSEAESSVLYLSLIHI